VVRTPDIKVDEVPLLRVYIQSQLLKSEPYGVKITYPIALVRYVLQILHHFLRKSKPSVLWRDCDGRDVPMPFGALALRFAQHFRERITCLGEADDARSSFESAEPYT
jgi:hypothetical protein